jgi:hypothetical protein
MAPIICNTPGLRAGSGELLKDCSSFGIESRNSAPYGGGPYVLSVPCQRPREAHPTTDLPHDSACLIVRVHVEVSVAVGVACQSIGLCRPERRQEQTHPALLVPVQTYVSLKRRFSQQPARHKTVAGTADILWPGCSL